MFEIKKLFVIISVQLSIVLMPSNDDKLRDDKKNNNEMKLNIRRILFRFTKHI